jgi:hypothetical protein
MSMSIPLKIWLKEMFACSLPQTGSSLPGASNHVCAQIRTMFFGLAGSSKPLALPDSLSTGRFPLVDPIRIIGRCTGQ